MRTSSAPVDRIMAIACTGSRTRTADPAALDGLTDSNDMNGDERLPGAGRHILLQRCDAP
jgi:hypothetical protein